MKIKSFKLKLVLTYSLIVLVSFGVTVFFLDRNLEENSLQNIRSSLITQAMLIEPNIPAENILKRNVAELQRVVKELSPKAGCRITIINTEGKVLADSDESLEDIPVMENHINRPEVRSALNGKTSSYTRPSPTLKINMLYMAIPLKNNGSTIGVLRLALTLESVRNTLSAVRKPVLFGLVCALALAFLLGSIIAGRALESVNRMIQISRRFSEGDFSRRIIGVPKDEIGDLAETLNKMAEDIENKISQIKTQNQKLEAVFNSMIEGIMVLDKNGRIVSANPSFGKIFGVSKNNIEGMMFLEAIRNNDMAVIIDTVFKTGSPLAREVALVYPVRGVFEVSAVPIFDKENISGCLAVFHDITEIRRLESMRRDFVANVSHELKTPLTSIKGFVETLLSGAMDDKENNRNFLKIIQDQTERLTVLVDDLLSLAYLESKKITLDRSDVKIKQLLDTVVSGFKTRLMKNSINLINDLPDGLSVSADKNKIEEVFMNLIDNAVKFNKQNGTIRVYGEEREGKVMITVEDSGIGIPEKDMPRIFERFYRVDKARSREMGGTGLGLSIVKHIIEIHGGSVGLDSAEGIGSKFRIMLPR